MSIIIKPQWDDIEIRRKKRKIDAATLRFNITGCEEAEDADNALATHAPHMILCALRQSSTSVNRLAKNAFEGVVEYAKEEGENDDESDNGYSISFDTTGGTQHITQSYATRGRYAAQGFTAPNHGGAIGVDDGNINGCDIIVPTLGFCMSKQLSGALNTGFLKMLASLTGKVNSTPFEGFDAGEVLFEGASGSKQGQGAWDVAYKFKASPNVQSMTVGNIQVGYKRGWDYFWVQYLEQKDDEAKTSKKVPFAAYVEIVYHEADFSPLLY